MSRVLLAALTLFAVLPHSAAFAQSSIQKIEVNLPFDDVEQIVVAEMRDRNLNLVNTMDIRKGMENRGGAFRKFKIFQFCNLELGIRIYRDFPDYGAMQFCSLLVYEVAEGRTAVAATRQTWALQQLPNHRPGRDAIEAARTLERLAKEIMDAVVEEAKSKAKAR